MKPNAARGGDSSAHRPRAGARRQRHPVGAVDRLLGFAVVRTRRYDSLATGQSGMGGVVTFRLGYSPGLSFLRASSRSARSRSSRTRRTRSCRSLTSSASFASLAARAGSGSAASCVAFSAPPSLAPVARDDPPRSCQPAPARTSSSSCMLAHASTPNNPSCAGRMKMKDSGNSVLTVAETATLASAHFQPVRCSYWAIP